MKIRFIKPFRFIGNAPDDGSDGTVPVGYVVDLKNDETTQWLIDNGFAEKVDDEWPQVGDAFWSISSDAISYEHDWRNYAENRRKKAIGNVFKTRKAADRFVDYLKAVETVSHDEGFMKKGNDRFVYPIIAHNNLGAVSAASSSRQHAGEFYFDSYEHAQASLDKHRDEWRTILDYDWSKE